MSYGSNDSSLFLFLIFLLFNDYKVFNGGFLSLIYIYTHTCYKLTIIPTTPWKKRRVQAPVSGQR